MARLNIIGFETGAAADELVTLNGTCSIQSTTKRSGGYALKVNPADAVTGYVDIRGIGSDGATADFNLAEGYVRFYVRFVTFPASGVTLLCSFQAIGGASNVGRIQLTAARNLELFNAAGTSVVVGSSVLTTGVWHRIEMRLQVGTSGIYEVRLNGATEFSGTANFGTTNGFRYLFGITNASVKAQELYFDDIAIDDSQWPGPASITRLDPNAAGYSAFTSQIGTFADVDDYGAGAGNDGDTTQIDAFNFGTDTLGIQCGASGLLRDSILCAKGIVAARNGWGLPVLSGSGSNNSGANVTTSTPDIATLTGTPAAGDLIIIAIAKDGTGAFTWPGGWSTPTGWADLTFAATNNQGVLSIRYRIFVAGDANPAITTASEGTAWYVWRFKAGSFDAGTAPEAASASGDGTNPDPPNLDPANWATEYTYWLAVAANDGNTAITAAPTNYTTGFSNSRWANTNGVGIAGSNGRQLTTGAENPGVFTMATEQWGAATIAIRPFQTLTGTWAMGVRGNSTNSLVSAAAGSNIYAARHKLQQRAPDGADWTVASIDGAEVVAERYSTTDNHQIVVTAMALMVEAADSVPSLVTGDRRVRQNPLLRR